MFQIPPEVLKYRNVIKDYQDRLTVDQVSKSDLLTVSFDSFSPRKAAAIANAHTKAFLRLGEERRFDSTSGAKTFLEKQIEEAQASLEASEKALTDLARKQNIVDVEDRSNVMAIRLEELNSALTRTRQDRIVAEVAYRQAERGEIESLPAVLEGSLIKELREDYAALEAEYKEKSRVFKDTYPKMQQLAAKMDRPQGHPGQGERPARYRAPQQLRTTAGPGRTADPTGSGSAADHAGSQGPGDSIQHPEAGMGGEQRAFLRAARQAKGRPRRRRYGGQQYYHRRQCEDSGGEAHPKIKLNVAIAGVFGLMAGLGIAFLLAFMDNSFRNRGGPGTRARACPSWAWCRVFRRQ